MFQRFTRHLRGVLRTSLDKYTNEQRKKKKSGYSSASGTKEKQTLFDFATFDSISVRKTEEGHL